MPSILGASRPRSRAVAVGNGKGDTHTRSGQRGMGGKRRYQYQYQYQYGSMMEQKEPNYKQMLLCLIIIVAGCIWNFYPISNIKKGPPRYKYHQKQAMDIDTTSSSTNTNENAFSNVDGEDASAGTDL